MPEQISIVCVQCGNVFHPRPGKIEAARVYCSHRCANQRPKNFTTHTCDQCGKEFTLRLHAGQVRRFCSRTCRANFERKGYIHRGYIVTRNGTGKQVFQHRLIAEEMLGRPLLETEDVHHINGITTDNRPQNLQVLSRSDHMKITARNQMEAGTIHLFPNGPDNPKYKHGRYCK